MTKQEPHDSIEETTQTNGSVGAKLKHCREQQNLSIDAFVAFSSFSKSKIEALERGEFRKIGIETFVTGYIRKYCAWLGENSDEYIALYKQESSRQTALVAQKSTETPLSLNAKNNTLNEDSYSTQQSKSILGKPLPFVFVLFIIGFCGMLMFFSGSKDDAVSQDIPGANEQTVITDYIIDTSDPKALADSFGQSITPAVSVVDGEREQTQLNTEQTSNAPSVTPIQDNTVLVTEPVITQQAPAVKGNVLRLMFIEDCWLELKDSDARVLFAGLKKAGSEHVEIGDGPFEIMLGNARAATVTLNDERVAFEPIADKKTLRFNVGN